MIEVMKISVAGIFVIQALFVSYAGAVRLARTVAAMVRIGPGETRKGVLKWRLTRWFLAFDAVAMALSVSAWFFGLDDGQFFFSIMLIMAVILIETGDLGASHGWGQAAGAVRE